MFSEITDRLVHYSIKLSYEQFKSSILVTSQPQLTKKRDTDSRDYGIIKLFNDRTQITDHTRRQSCQIIQGTILIYGTKCALVAILVTT